MAATRAPYETGAQKAKEEKGKGLDLKEAMVRQAGSIIDGQKEKIAERLKILAVAMRQTAGQLEAQEKGEPASKYLHAVSSKVEAASGYLRERDVADLLEDARGQIRRRPALALGGAFLAGFFLGRYLNSARGSGEEGH